MIDLKTIKEEVAGKFDLSEKKGLFFSGFDKN